MNSLKKGEGVPLLNFEGGPGVLLLNFEGGPGVPLLNFEGAPRSRVTGSRGEFFLEKYKKFFKLVFCFVFGLVVGN